MKRTMILIMLAALLASAFGGASVTPVLALETGVDLVPTEIVTSASHDTSGVGANEFYENDDVGISITVENSGDTASGNYAINFAIRSTGAPAVNTSCGSTDWDYFVESTSLEGSTIDKTEQQTWNITILAGDLPIDTYEVTVFVDSGCSVDEIDDNNNVLTHEFSIIAVPPEFNVPANDDIANAIDLAPLNLPFSTGVIDTRGATRGNDDPSELNCKPTTDPLDTGLASIWYTYTPDEDQNLVLDTVGSDYDTYLAVFKDSSPLEFVDCNDDIDSSNTLQSSLPIKLQGGVKYYFLVGQFVILGNSDGIQAQAGSNTFVFNISEGREISGNTGEPNVTLTYANNFNQTVTSGADGKYTIVVPSGWSGTVTPFKTGVAFLPSQRTYTDVTTDLTSENYTARQTYYSVGAQDGWVLESGEFTVKGGKLNKGATVIRLGDDTLNRQYRSILSFNTANLPDTAGISKATLRVRRQGVAGGGNPVNTFGGFMVDIKKGNFGKAGLQLADFSTKGTKTIGAFKPKLVGGWYTINLTKGKIGINKAGNTQIRLRFKLDDNNNSVANFLKLYSGNAPLASRPQLLIEYSLPTGQ